MIYCGWALGLIYAMNKSFLCPSWVKRNEVLKGLAKIEQQDLLLESNAP